MDGDLHRSRRALVAVAVAAGLGVAACGGSGGAATTTTTTKPAAARVRQTVLTYGIEPGATVRITPASIGQTVAVMRERLRLAGVADGAVTTSGSEVRVTIPDGRNAATARQLVGTTARLAFYDWERNVVGTDGRTAPTDPDVTGGQSAGQPGVGATQAPYDAVEQASRLPRENASSDTTAGLWYGVDAKGKRILCGPQNTEAAARAACANAAKRPTSYAEVPEGYVVVQAESDATDPRSVAAADDASFILRDRPALRGGDVTDPEQDTDQTTGAPTVTFGFTSAGHRKWRALTRAISRRGRAAMLPGVSPQSVANHFAIVLDDRLISVPYIDPQQNPHGISGANGSEISGGFTLETARNLANLLKAGPLPLPLMLLSAS